MKTYFLLDGIVLAALLAMYTELGIPKQFTIISGDSLIIYLLNVALQNVQNKTFI